MRFEGRPFFDHPRDPTRHAAYVRELICVILFTAPGERVNRPDFGAGLLSLVFEPNQPDLAAAVEATAVGAIQRWLGDLVELGSLRVRAEESILHVDLDYKLRQTGERCVESVSSGATR